LLSKEAKRMAQTFETASKSAQDPEIKAFAEKWLAAVKKHSTDVDKAEDEIGKRK
jgi:predicted outer membrane protein